MATVALDSHSVRAMQGSRQRPRLLAAAALALVCGSCDGGGSSAPIPSSSTPSPSPVPTPAPSAPAPTLPAGIQSFGTLGQTTPQAFAVLGFSVRGKDGGFGYVIDPATLDTQSTTGLRLAAVNQLVLSVAGQGEGTLIPNGGNGIDPQGRLVQASYNVLGGVAGLQETRLIDGTVLKNTGHGSWVSAFTANDANPYLLISFVYGVPTAPSSIPQGGINLYRIAFGPPGSALTVDFTARTVSGTITLQEEGGAVHVYALQDVVLTGDRTEFKGRIASSTNGKTGEIQGRFTGSAGEEIMARYFIPGITAPNYPAGIFSAMRQ